MRRDRDAGAAVVEFVMISVLPDLRIRTNTGSQPDYHDLATSPG
jgi:hypothetical protein